MGVSYNARGPATTLLESGGSLLSLGSIADDSLLVRDGSTIKGTKSASALGTSSSVAATIGNTTAATAGTPVQYSPILSLSGTAWDTDDLVSRTEEWALQVRPASGAVPNSTLYLLNRQDSGAWVSKFSVTSSGGQIAATSAIFNGNFALYSFADLATGLGACASIAHFADRPTGFIQKARTDGANNIVFFDCWDRDAAAITNASSMRLHSFGWTNNSDVYTELASIRCDGAVYGVSHRVSGDLGGVASHVTFTNTVEGAAGAATGNYLVIYDGTTKLKLQLFADS